MVAPIGQGAIQTQKKNKILKEHMVKNRQNY
jgi:hypothetical protein